MRILRDTMCENRLFIKLLNICSREVDGSISNKKSLNQTIAFSFGY